MLMVSVWPKSGFLRWPCDYRQQSLLVSSVCVVQYIFRSRPPAVPGRWWSHPLLLTLASISVPPMRVRNMR